MYLRRFDRLVGWPFRWLLKVLNKLTGLNNLWLARIMLFAGLLCFTSGSIADFRTKIQDPRYWIPTALGIVIAGLIAHVVTILLNIFADQNLVMRIEKPTTSLPSIMVLVIITRLYLVSQGVLVLPASLLSKDAPNITTSVGSFLLAAGLYFLTDSRPKRLGWIGQAIKSQIGRGHAGPQSSAASMVDHEKVDISSL